MHYIRYHFFGIQLRLVSHSCMTITMRGSCNTLIFHHFLTVHLALIASSDAHRGEEVGLKLVKCGERITYHQSSLPGLAPGNQDFPGGHPSQNSSGSSVLNCGVFPHNQAHNKVHMSIFLN